MAVMVDDVLLDYGMKPGEPPEYPVGGVRPEAVIVSHAHLDHSGVVINLMDMPLNVYMTPVTRDLTILLARDTLKISERTGRVPPFTEGDIQTFMHKADVVDYEEEFIAGEYIGTLHDAGHIPGSSSVHLQSTAGEDSLYYTGDFNTRDTRLLTGVRDGAEARVLMIEGTYFGVDHPPREELERAFIDSVVETLDRGGVALVPAFAIGRTQEMLLVLHRHGFRPYVDGMGKDVFNIFLQHPEYLRDAGELREAFDEATPVDPRMRRHIIDEPCVIVTTAGMLNGGPILYYLKRLYDDPRSKVLLTGYQVEGTNGRMALDNGVVEVDGQHLHLGLDVEQYDFSAHSGDAELKHRVEEFADNGTEAVISMHGDEAENFAEWIRNEVGIDAYAPENGDELHL